MTHDEHEHAHKDEQKFELDFNVAYNPSCVFSPAYDCPYPPPDNRLTVDVSAGELLPMKEGAN